MGHLLHAAVKFLDHFDTRHRCGSVRLLVGVVPALIFAAMNRLHYDSITAGKDVDALVGEPIVNALLRDEPRDLAADRNDALVGPQLSRSVSRAIDDHRLRKRSQILRCLKFTGLDGAACDREIVHQLARVAGYVECQRGLALNVPGWKWRRT